MRRLNFIGMWTTPPSSSIRIVGFSLIRKQIAAYKRFKSLPDEWIDLSIEASKLSMQIDKKKGSG